VTGLSKSEVAKGKRDMLIAMEFDLHTSVQEYSMFLGMLEKHLSSKVMKALSTKDRMQLALGGGKSVQSQNSSHSGFAFA
jgi:hypothetical protein